MACPKGLRFLGELKPDTAVRAASFSGAVWGLAERLDNSPEAFFDSQGCFIYNFSYFIRSRPVVRECRVLGDDREFPICSLPGPGRDLWFELSEYSAGVPWLIVPSFYKFQ